MQEGVGLLRCAPTEGEACSERERRNDKRHNSPQPSLNLREGGATYRVHWEVRKMRPVRVMKTRKFQRRKRALRPFSK